MPVILDSGPLVAAFNQSDHDHAACAALLRRTDLQFVVPALCVGESAELLDARSGWRNQAVFLRAVAELHIYLPLESEWGLIADEVVRYAEFDIGATDASVIVLARRLQADTVATLDHRHFRTVRPGHVPAFTLLP